jgi:hypothetical protein
MHAMPVPRCAVALKEVAFRTAWLWHDKCELALSEFLSDLCWNELQEKYLLV